MIKIRNFSIEIAEELWMKMKINVFERLVSQAAIPHKDNFRRIDQLEIYTQIEEKRENKKVWKKMQRMFLRKKFSSLRNSVDYWNLA